MRLLLLRWPSDECGDDNSFMLVCVWRLIQHGIGGAVGGPTANDYTCHCPRNVIPAILSNRQCFSD